MLLLKEKQAQLSPEQSAAGSQLPRQERASAAGSKTAQNATPNVVGTRRGETLSDSENELLQDTLESWSSPPENWIKRPLEEEERLRVIDALFRSALVSQSRELIRQLPEVIRSHQIQITGGQSLLLNNSEWRGKTLLGRATWGDTLTVPVESIEKIQSIPKSELSARKQAEVQQRIDRLLASQRFHERTEALLLLIQQGDFTRASQQLPDWYAAGGAHHLAEAQPDPETRELWRRLARELKAPAVQQIAEPSPQPRVQSTSRNLLTLEAFLSKNKKLRGLDEGARSNLVKQCTEWTEWLEKHPQALSIPDGRRASLGEELRLLRYDLLKAGGF